MTIIIVIKCNKRTRYPRQDLPASASVCVFVCVCVFFFFCVFVWVRLCV
jgi:hypothetical protein